jgi:acetyl-CoA carboxylase biotin carboxylase subunit
LARAGDKLAARHIAEEVGIPVLAGPDEVLPAALPPTFGTDLSYPLLVKAVAGGGGRGIRLVDAARDLADAITAARREAVAAFGDGGVYLEPYLSPARHIEVQILGDGTGRILCLSGAGRS